MPTPHPGVIFSPCIALWIFFCNVNEQGGTLRLDFKYKIESKKEFPNLTCVPYMIDYLSYKSHPYYKFIILSASQQQEKDTVHGIK